MAQNDLAVAVVGDVVASRAFDDQERLLEGLAASVAAMPHARSAAATIGDEFQAVFDGIAPAVAAVARLRLDLLVAPPTQRPIELRVGFGVGAIITTAGGGAAAPGQSGSAWWHAREALERVETERRGWPPLRWWAAGRGDLAPTRAALIGLDTMLARFDEVDVSLARGLLDARTATALAEEVGMTKQSVSARLRDHGVYGWVRTLQTLTQELA